MYFCTNRLSHDDDMWYTSLLPSSFTYFYPSLLPSNIAVAVIITNRTFSSTIHRKKNKESAQHAEECLH